MSDQRGVPSFHIDQIDHPEQDLIVRILDDQAALPGVVRMREWARAALALQPGETALDLGSGTGTEVVELAALVGDAGRAIGIDPNPAMLAAARERTADVKAEFLEGSAYDLPLPDASVDAVRCERVYQHLDDPAKATAEIARVLRPGGRVVLIDSDWSTAIFHPGDPELIAALQHRMAANSPNRNSGRRLRGQLVEAGLVIDDIGSEAVIWEPESVLAMCAAITERGVADGSITAAQRDRVLADIEHGAKTGDYHFSVTMFAVVAHKP
ncbi:methyltransferase domain-containing protein [Nocardia vaccinii]|uniref:methyltransferase domain-containing protein n=1 Tax=Nocardia vaccinii TaxID=1822 RepID=UPI00082F60D2|nr:methyltransferase domain-containing protein [Nocardia vaccinii]